ncbi:MAG: hypothetical protein IKR81_16830 [Victivallales bacterium]|nr:hypothetical protein [Victivallales bacterium]
MTVIQCLWGVIGAQWALMLLISGYFFKKYQDIEHNTDRMEKELLAKIAETDTDTKVRLTAIETQLASIKTTLLEIKKEIRETYNHA